MNTSTKAVHEGKKAENKQTKRKIKKLQMKKI